MLQGAERGPLFGGHLLGAHEPEILRARETRVIRLLQRSVLGAANVVDGVMEMLGDMELVEDDLAVGVLQMGARRLDVRLPQVHGDRLNAVTLLGRQGCPEAIQTLLLPVLGQIEDPALLQIRHHRQVPVPLRDGGAGC